MSLEQDIHLADQHLHQGKFADAEALYRRVLVSHPTNARLLAHLGIALAHQGKSREALQFLERGVATDPRYAPAHFYRGWVLMEAGELAGAIPSLRDALKCDPRHIDALNRLILCHHRLHQEQECVDALHEALRLEPNNATHHAYLGQTLNHLGRLDEAMLHLRRAVELNPNHPEYRMAYGFALLRDRNFADGWRLSQARLFTSDFNNVTARMTVPMWDGSPLDGKTLFIQPEQGFGDLIQAVRYVPILAARGARVVIGCHAPLKRLLQNVAGATAVLAEGEQAGKTDCYIPALCIPRVLNTDLSNIPRQVPYLRADPGLVRVWQERLGVSDNGLSVGLVWAGSPRHAQDYYRSIPLAALAPFASVPQVKLYSLQLGTPAEQIKSSPLALMDLSNSINDFADTAAILVNLDLLISVDTAPVHLAGALARPVWNMITVNPDWRWMRHREDSPWYPTMRLFRQTRFNDWSDVIDRVVDQLRSFRGASATTSPAAIPPPSGSPPKLQ